MNRRPVTQVGRGLNNHRAMGCESVDRQLKCVAGPPAGCNWINRGPPAGTNSNAPKSGAVLLKGKTDVPAAVNQVAARREAKQSCSAAAKIRSPRVRGHRSVETQEIYRRHLASCQLFERATVFAARFVNAPTERDAVDQ